MHDCFFAPMQAMTGIEIDGECISVFEEMKIRHTQVGHIQDRQCK